MTRVQKVGVVAAGYAAALVAGGLAMWAYDASIPAAIRDASSGMYAFGSLLAGAATFGFLALVPTVMLLILLRPYTSFWNALSVTAIVGAAAGLLASLNLLFGSYPNTTLGNLGSLFALFHMLGVPLWALTIAILVFIAPGRDARLRLLVALGLEFGVGICTIVQFVGKAARD